LGPIITDFIRNTKRELYGEKLEDFEGSKDEEQPIKHQSKDENHRLNTSPIYRGNASNKNGPARVKRRIAPFKPLAVEDPCFCQKEKCMPQCINQHEVGFTSRDTRRRVWQNSSRVATLGRTP